MSDKTLSSLLHGVEALVVLAVSLGIAHFFPENKMEALGIAFSILSVGAKGARISNVVPIPDYINPSKNDTKKKV